MNTTITALEAQTILANVGMDFATIHSTEPLSDWAFMLEGEMEISTGIMWKGTLNHIDLGSIIVENAGGGGCNLYIGERGVKERFFADARIVFPDEVEAEDVFTLLLDVLSSLTS